MLLIFQLAILIMSVVIHEVSHGYAAYFQGDHTAEYEGRLTLNPLKHLDLVGSFIVPLISFTVGGFIIGWAKPVPFNPYNLRNRKWGEAIVAIAGPLSNFVIALIFGLIVRFTYGSLGVSFVEIFTMITLINVMLGVFNLMPVPPLDGSKILFALFPTNDGGVRRFLEKNSLFIALLFIFFVWQFIAPIAYLIFKAITGLQF